MAETQPKQSVRTAPGTSADDARKESEQQNANPTAPAPTSPSSEKSSRMKNIMMMGGVLVLGAAIGAAATWLIFKRKAKKAAPTS